MDISIFGWDFVETCREMEKLKIKREKKRQEQEEYGAKIFREKCAVVMREEMHIAQDNHRVPVNWEDYDKWRSGYGK